jgi:UDP-N-acetylglucosamine 1-carboxyvinyltransferase
LTQEEKYKLDKLIISGGNPLYGKVKISGAKNAALAILSASLLTDETCIIENVPYIGDVITLCDILRGLGVDVRVEKDGKIYVLADRVREWRAPYDMVQKMRASYYLLGVLLSRFGKAEVGMPGGCDIGPRPIDQHVKAFEAMGAQVQIEHGTVFAETDGLRGNEVYFDKYSVGATINAMLSAVKAHGQTLIVNAAKEPHVVDLASYLNSMGADIRGAGTDEIKIRGVEYLHGSEYTIIPDQIEAGTYMIAAAATGGDVTITDVIPKHLEAVSAKLMEAGVMVEEGADWVRVYREQRPQRINIQTQPYPGFPTDMQQPMAVLLSVADGTSIITENIFDSRFKYLEELRKMGAKVQVDGRVAIIEGVEELTGAPVEASDLRAGASMVIAGLVARGVTEISNSHFIDRGYEDIESKLSELGADIQRMDRKGRTRKIKAV